MIAPILAFLTSSLGRWVVGSGLVALAFLGVYGKGRHDGKASYQAKLAREMNQAIKTGNDAKQRALKEFDANKDIEDDEFERR